jgi:hypothetical protein
MKSGCFAFWVSFAVCAFRPGFAMMPLAGKSPVQALVLIEDGRDPAFTTLDARLEAVAVTAALIRTQNVVLALADQNLTLMSALHKTTPQGNEATLQKEAVIRGAIDTATESYLRLIGKIEGDASMADIAARVAAVDQAMGFRGQGAIKTALPAILLHIHLIHDGSAPSRDTVIRDLLALPNQ